MILVDMIAIHAEFLENIYNLNAKKAKTTWVFVYFCKLILDCKLCQFSPNIFIYGSIAIFYNIMKVTEKCFFNNVVFRTFHGRI